MRIWIVLVLLLSACDCMQIANGIVVDASNNKPVKNIGINKSGRIIYQYPIKSEQYTDSFGYFRFSAVSGGICKCPDLTLYFTKEGYQPIIKTYPNYHNFDTIWVKKSFINYDSSEEISILIFTNLLSFFSPYIKKNKLNKLNRAQHIQLIKTINTIQQLNSGQIVYEQFEKLCNDKNLALALTKIYPHWITTKGMGYYIIELDIDLLGEPRKFAYYNIKR